MERFMQRCAMGVSSAWRGDKALRLEKDRRARLPVVKRGLCRVCQSPYRSEYERLLLDGWAYRALSRRSKELEERPIDAHSFSTHDKRHFRPHLEGEVTERLRHSEMADEVVHQWVKVRRQVIDELETNLELLKKLRAQIPDRPTSAAMVRETTRLLDTIWRMQKELAEEVKEMRDKGEVPEEMLARDMAQIVEILCPVCRERLAEAIGVDDPDPRAMARRVV
ncbi:hypothetical protein M1N20_03055 [Dehalococcoidia bacterium]|nr:hypothetical protein [Dehalococcoidia bacterium]